LFFPTPFSSAPFWSATAIPSLAASPHLSQRGPYFLKDFFEHPCSLCSLTSLTLSSVPFHSPLTPRLILRHFIPVFCRAVFTHRAALQVSRLFFSLLLLLPRGFGRFFPPGRLLLFLRRFPISYSRRCFDPLYRPFIICKVAEFVGITGPKARCTPDCASRWTAPMAVLTNIASSWPPGLAPAVPTTVPLPLYDPLTPEPRLLTPPFSSPFMSCHFLWAVEVRTNPGFLLPSPTLLCQ